MLPGRDHSLLLPVQPVLPLKRATADQRQRTSEIPDNTPGRSLSGGGLLSPEKKPGDSGARTAIGDLYTQKPTTIKSLNPKKRIVPEPHRLFKLLVTEGLTLVLVRPQPL
jgi:hypothetical protein